MMISNEQRACIENLYEAQGWRGQSPYAASPIRHFALGAIYLHGWRLHRLWRNQSPQASTGMIVRAGDKLDEITSVASILLWESASVSAAHDQLLAVLCEMQSNAIKRNRQREVGDVLFSLADTMFLFARANLVVLIRNAGSQVLSLGEMAGTIDVAILRHLQKGQPAKAGPVKSE
jgi:hypothetical protein